MAYATVSIQGRWRHTEYYILNTNSLHQATICLLNPYWQHS